jgi:tetratricopeptide (TPR) repeat protein
MKNILTICLLVLLALLPTPAKGETGPAPVRAWEETLTIPTYPWETDWESPLFAAIDGSIIYPYPMQDILSATLENRSYRALCLENEYLRLVCLPELGGRIHSVLDKTTGEQMFHHNPVIKPGLIGMCGAWIAGGVEWNTGPHGHTVTAVSPVEGRVEHNSDGSAEVLVSNTERIFKTRWEVRVRLLPGRSFLEESIRILNETEGVHPYYFWNCTAFPCTETTRFIFPMSLGCDHNGEQFFRWPIHEGKDLSWLKNYEEATSIFAHGCVHDFFGAYDTGRDQGLVQYADHRVLPGKKAWTWGESEDGAVSQKALMDDGTRYIEVQSGPLRTQADHGFLYPGQEVAWQEWWYPVHGLGEGFDFANRDLAVRVEKEARGGLKVSILGTGVFPECGVWVERCEGEPDQVVDLSPESPAVFTLADSQNEPVRFCIHDRSGNPLADFTWPLEIPEVDPPGADWMSSATDSATLTVEQAFLKARKFDQQTNRATAAQWYEAALAKDASHTDSLLGAAILDYEAGLYEKAKESLEEAVERDPEKGWAWYYLSLCQRKSNDFLRSSESAAQAARFLKNEPAAAELMNRLKESRAGANDSRPVREPAGLSAATGLEAAIWKHHAAHPDQPFPCPPFASTVPSDYYPSFPETLDLLRGGPENYSDRPALALLKGNLLAGLGRIAEATPLWESAAESEPSAAMAWRNLGMTAWKVKKDPARAKHLLTKALESAPQNQTYRKVLAEVLIESGSPAEAIELIEEVPPPELRRGDLIELLAKALVQESRYDEAIDLLSESSFSNWEGRKVSRGLFVQALFGRGKASLEAGQAESALADFKATLTYPEHLGVGRPAHPEEAESFFWMGRALEALGNYDEAIATWHRGRKSPGTSAHDAEFRAQCEAAIDRAEG